MDFSGIVFIVFIAFLAYRNAMRAKAKEKSAGLYAFLTVLLFFVFEMIGGVFVVLLFCRGEINLSLANNPANKQLLVDQMNQAFLNSPIRQFTLELFGIGGYLLVRYILDSVPEKKKKLPLWPDTDNENAV